MLFKPETLFLLGLTFISYYLYLKKTGTVDKKRGIKVQPSFLLQGYSFLLERVFLITLA